MEDEMKIWMEKIEKAKGWQSDLSRDEDLAIAIMNLISLEEHFHFTAMKTGNQKYLEMLDSVRQLRKSMMEQLISDPQGEEWCISKHLLAASMRLMEVGTKELSKSGPEKAEMFFKASFDLFSLFFAINMKLVEPKKLEAAAMSGIASSTGTANKAQPGNVNAYMRKFSDMVKKVVDCCKEW